MDHNSFKQQITQLAVISDSRTITASGAVGSSTNYYGGPVVEQLLLTTQHCKDCNKQCQGQPRKTFAKKGSKWTETCQECGMVRSDSGEFVSKARMRYLKRASDSLTKPLLKPNQQSRPTELVPIDCSDDAVESEDFEQDLEPDVLVHQDPVSCDPGDHLRLDIVIHKCSHEHQD